MNRRAILSRNIAWATVIFVLCAIPPGTIPASRGAIPQADKLVHFFLFLVMSLLLHAATRPLARPRPARAILLVILCCTAYGGMIEILQARYLHRGGEWMDLLADSAGAVAGSLAYLALGRWKRKRPLKGVGKK
ncbi:MAG: VanZ family protein [Odoribacteraceae bacterium]|jgi:VanZ family protein|nr:VanZ family protein [Odoribacteraceae bacterium]